MTIAATANQYIGRRAVDPQGSKIGLVGQVYLDDETGRPDWATVNTGLFGSRENFVPLRGSRIDGDDLVLPFDKDVVKDSPEIADSSHLDLDEEQSLYAYYEQYLRAGGDRAEYEQTTATAGRRNTRQHKGHETSRSHTDDVMTRSEERLRVGTEQVETGRARLRKYIVTEQQSVDVPISREEVRVEREPITDANRGEALSGTEITEDEHEIVLHEERPVVTTETVPVERVRLGTETLTRQEKISGEVRKERVEIDDERTPNAGPHHRQPKPLTAEGTRARS
jgi:uncharacterized protein (TIGR02271 family)